MSERIGVDERKRENAFWWLWCGSRHRRDGGGVLCRISSPGFCPRQVVTLVNRCQNIDKSLCAPEVRCELLATNHLRLLSRVTVAKLHASRFLFCRYQSEAMMIVFQVLFVLTVSAGVWSVKIYGVVGPLPRKHSFITPWVHTHG